MLGKVDKYTLLEKIGSGTAGIVYLASDPDIVRSVAIKILKAEYFGSSMVRTQAVERFQREIRAIGRLAHPNIVSIYDSGLTSEGLPFLVMQYVNGRGLDVVQRDSGDAMEPLRALNILKQLASALDYAHSQDVVHRDIKPSNILVSENDCVHIVDFSTAIVSDATLTPMGQVVGTPQYMAPEVIRGERASASADLYSLGIIAFTLFTGKRPFRDGGIAATFNAVLNQSPFSFSELGVNLGAKLERVLRRALAKDPSDRFQSAKEFVTQCEDALSKSGVAVFSEGAPATEKVQAYSSGIFKNPSAVRRRFYGERLFSLRALSFITLIVLLAGVAFGSFIVFGLDKSSPLSRRLRAQMAIGYTKKDLAVMNNYALQQVLALRMPERTLRAAIGEVVRRDSADLAEAITVVLGDPRAGVRTEAVKALVIMTSMPAETRNVALTASVADRDPFIRIFCACELARLQGKGARAAIQKQRDQEQDPLVARVLDFILMKA